MYLYNKYFTYDTQNTYNNYFIRARIKIKDNVVFDEFVMVYKDGILIGKRNEKETILYTEEPIYPIIELFNNDLKQMGYEI